MNLFGNSNSANQITRTVGSGINEIVTTDKFLDYDRTNGNVILNLPKISDFIDIMTKSGNLNALYIVLSDITPAVSANNLVLNCDASDNINGLSSFTSNTVLNFILQVTPSGWLLVQKASSAPPTPPFNSPYDFYLDAAAPAGGDGSIESPFNTITALNNAVIALANPTQGYVGNIAPSDTGYGSEVIGSLSLAPNLSLVGQIPQNTGIGCNINYIGLASGSVVQFRNLAFNGVFNIDLSLSSFASISFQNGVVNINRTDSNPAAFVSLSAGIGGGTISGTVLIENGILLSDLTINDGADVYAVNTFLLGSRFLLNGNCILKTLSTLNPYSGYIDGTVNGSGTPTWYVDEASNQTYTGTVNKIGFSLEWELDGNSNGAIKSIGTLDNFDFPIVVNGAEVTRITTDKRQFWNDTKTNNGSNAGLQYSSLTANRAQLRNNQYGANNAGAGLTTFKSRGLVIGAPLQAGDGVLVGDILQGFTAIGVTGNGLLIPIAYTQRVTVAQSNPTSLATDWTIQLCPLNGVTNSIRNAFGVTSEGIQKVRESANSMAGLAVLDAAGQIVISNTNVKATTRFLITVQDGGAVPSGSLIYQSARTINTDFTITSKGGSLDAGVQVYYQLYEQLT